MPPQKTHVQEVIIEAWHLRVWRRYKESWFDKYVRFSIPLAFIIFLVAVFGIQTLVIDYTNGAATNPVGDIILSNIPVFSVGDFFVYGMFLFVLVVGILSLMYPKRIIFTLHAMTLFVLVRSLFVSLTHIGPFTTQVASDFGPAITQMFFGADHFFSGHAGAPFLMALMYWENKLLRYIFLAWSVFFSIIVLLGHLHYTIDVLAAFFITYGIYHTALWLFPRERMLFLSDR